MTLGFTVRWAAAVITTAVYGAATAQSTPFVVAGCGGPAYNRIAPLSCKQLSLVPGTLAGACGQLDGPTLVTQFNLSAQIIDGNSNSASAIGAKSVVNLPGVVVVVTDANGTALGMGRRLGVVPAGYDVEIADAAAILNNPTSYSLEFGCVPIGNKRVIDSATCVCTATPQFAYSDLNNASDPAGEVELQWVLSCRVPLQSTVDSAALPGSPSVTCIGSYSEAGSIMPLTAGLPTP
eukprot:m.36087 g.36087  ORF g.36087 m.36087 type:complete len:236 (+) comp12832_c0_seq1:291-998(+)